jgi:hypothetical protein
MLLEMLCRARCIFTRNFERSKGWTLVEHGCEPEGLHSGERKSRGHLDVEHYAQGDAAQEGTQSLA